MTKKQNSRIAIVDDYVKVAKTIATYVRHMGCEPTVYTDPLEFLDALKDNAFDLLITDIRMPQMDGISLLKKVRKRAPKTQVIVVSAHADKKDAIDALKHGAYDFFEKPVGRAELVATIERTLGYGRVLRERDALAERLSLVTESETKKWGIKAFVGGSGPMKAVLKKIRLLQKSKKTNVLVLGESGTGKELVARAIHFGSDRAGEPFVAVNCSAIPSELAESILFGHTKGSFTGATADRKGQFELADGGTIFLDEIGDMPALVQTKLLRVLEDGIVIPVGRATGKAVDVRVVSATNTHIQTRASSGKFRLDLYHRLAAYVLNLPPLRDRRADLLPLAQHFVSLLSEEMGIAQPDIDKSLIRSLEKYEFPGNVRELRNILERAMIDAAGDSLRAEHVQLHSVVAEENPSEDESQIVKNKQVDLPFNLQVAQGILVRRALEHSSGNVAEASRLLGISRAKVYRSIE